MPWLRPYWQRELEGLPVFGDWILTTGQVVHIWSQPCEIEPAIYVEAFFHEAPLFIWSLVKPDPFDAAWGRFAPPGTPGPHSRRRRRGRPPLFRWNANGLIQPERVPGGRLARYLFPLGQLAQRIGFYFLIADATIDFALRWTTTVYQWSGCIDSEFWFKGVVDATVPPGGLVGDDAKISFLGKSNHNTEDHIFGDIVVPAHHHAQLTAKITLLYGGFVQCDHKVACTIRRSDNVEVYTVIPPSMITQDTNASGEASIEIKPLPYDRTYSVYASNLGSACTCRVTADSAFHGGQRIQTNLKADPP